MVLMVALHFTINNTNEYFTFSNAPITHCFDSPPEDDKYEIRKSSSPPELKICSNECKKIITICDGKSSNSNFNQYILPATLFVIFLSLGASVFLQMLGNYRHMQNFSKNWLKKKIIHPSYLQDIIMHSDQDIYREELKMLVEEGINPDIINFREPMFGDTCLHIALYCGKYEVLKKFIEKGNPYIKNDFRKDVFSLFEEKQNLDKALLTELVSLMETKKEVTMENGTNRKMTEAIKNKSFFRMFYLSFFVNHWTDVYEDQESMVTILQENIEKNNLLFDEKKWLHRCIVRATDQQGQTLLHLAARYRNVNCLEVAIKHKVDINSREIYDGRTALHYAAHYDSPKCATELIKNGADVNAKDFNNRTPLQIAIKSNSFLSICVLSEPKFMSNIPFREAISAMLNESSYFMKFADFPDQLNVLLFDEGTILHEFIRLKKNECACILIKIVKNREIRNEKGFTPLHIAAQNNNVQCLQLLIEKKAEIEAPTNENETPLFLSVRHGNYDCVEKLLEKGANTEAQSNGLLTPLFACVKECCQFDKEHENIIQLLLKHGAHIDARDEERQTALHVAAAHGKADILKTLIEVNEIQGKSNFADKRTETPLHKAVIGGHFECVKLILDYKYHIDTMNIDGCTPIYFAAEKGHDQILKLLIEKGGNLNDRNHNNETPLDAAERNGHEKCIELIKNTLEEQNKNRNKYIL
jgi:ankyrin repeat protein